MNIFTNCCKKGIIGLIWCLLWFILVSDSPTTHRLIGQEEREYISNATSKSVSKGSKYVRLGIIYFDDCFFFQIINCWFSENPMDTNNDFNSSLRTNNNPCMLKLRKLSIFNPIAELHE